MQIFAIYNYFLFCVLGLFKKNRTVGGILCRFGTNRQIFDQKMFFDQIFGQITFFDEF